MSIVFGAPVAWLWMWRFDKDGDGRKLGGTLSREGVVYDGLRDRGVLDIYTDSRIAGIHSRWWWSVAKTVWESRDPSMAACLDLHLPFRLPT